MTTDMSIANEIARQIGRRAFVMMGTTDKYGESNALIFNIKGSKWKKIKVRLDPSDTYTVIFYRQKRAPSFEIVSHEVNDIYCDQLHDVIERETGLYLRL